MTISSETLRTSMDIHIAPTRKEMGKNAAADIATAIRSELQKKNTFALFLQLHPARARCWLL